jgi:SAM-dependent methyltransferase
MDNYQYCVGYALALASGRDFSVLDYGCGAGQIVAPLRAAGVNACGCDVFFGGGDYSSQVPAEFWNTAVFPMQDGKIPFPSETFDLVVSNQVLEHVNDLPAVLAEMHRVLKPGGAVLSLFPDRSVWREGHCGIPLLHWFPKHSRLRVYYALTLRALGLGANKGNKGLMQWSEDFCQWLDQWTYYRPYAVITEEFGAYFGPLHHLEAEWLAARLGPRARSIPAWMRQLIAKKWGHLVFVCRKLPSESSPNGHAKQRSNDMHPLEVGGSPETR